MGGNIGKTIHAIIGVIGEDFGVFADVPLADIALDFVGRIGDILGQNGIYIVEAGWVRFLAAGKLLGCFPSPVDALHDELPESSRNYISCLGLLTEQIFECLSAIIHNSGLLFFCEITNHNVCESL